MEHIKGLVPLRAAAQKIGLGKQKKGQQKYKSNRPNEAIKSKVLTSRPEKRA